MKHTAARQKKVPPIPRENSGEPKKAVEKTAKNSNLSVVKSPSVESNHVESKTMAANVISIPKKSLPKAIEPKIKNSNRKIEPITAEKKTRAKAEMPVAARKANAPVEPIEKKNPVKIRNGRLVLPPLKKVEVAAIPSKTAMETVKLPISKPRKKPLEAFGAAIFRGKKGRYDFQVFPIDGEFEDAAAIYIISSRKVDKNLRAHHKMVCIGQSNSIFEELQKHRKGKCFKQYQVNAVSVLREENEQKRLKIEADLKSAHQIPCLHS